jgi:hypothetical protein
MRDNFHATLAQSVEQGIENPRVAGSIPAGGIFFAFFACVGFESKLRDNV